MTVGLCHVMNMRRSRGGTRHSSGLDGFVFVIADSSVSRRMRFRVARVGWAPPENWRASGRTARLSAADDFGNHIRPCDHLQISSTIGQRLLGGVAPYPSAHHEQFPGRHRCVTLPRKGAPLADGPRCQGAWVVFLGAIS